MLGSKPRGQLELLMAGALRDLVPDGHVLARVDRVLDLSWLRAEVSDCYAAPGIGRPGIDPEAVLRLMLAGFLLGIVHDRRLLHEAQVNIAIRWFAGYGLHGALPDHSSLTRVRQRWGAERFRAVFARTVRACVAAGIACGEVVHVDATLIRADVSWESLGVQHADAVLAQDSDKGEVADKAAAAKQRAERDGKKGRRKRICLTGPDASMATNARNRRLDPAYKQHIAVDDICGVVLDLEVTTGEANEGDHILSRVDAAAAATGGAVKIATADQGYAYGKVYGGLERRGIDPVIPAKKEPVRAKVPLRRFRYDARHDVLRCLHGKMLRPGKPVAHGRFFHSRVRDCSKCDLASICLSPGRNTKSVVVGDDHPALLRARRRKERWSEEDRRLYQRHRWRSKGFRGEAKTWHGLARAVWRGLENMRIQAFLTAAAINLKRLAAALAAALAALFAPLLALVGTLLGHLAAERAPTPSSPPRPHRQHLTLAPSGKGFFNSPTVYKHRNLLAHVPDALHEEVPADYTDMIYAETAKGVEAKRKTFLRKWRLRCPAVAASLEEAGDRLFAFLRLPLSQWKSARTTNAIERLHKEFKRRIKAQTVLPSAETAAMLFWALLASGQITMRKVNGWQTLGEKITAPIPVDLAA